MAAIFRIGLYLIFYILNAFLSSLLGIHNDSIHVSSKHLGYGNIISET